MSSAAPTPSSCTARPAGARSAACPATRARPAASWNRRCSITVSWAPNSPERGEPAVPSFDVVSEVNQHELANAVDQASRELDGRFDFRDSGASFTLAGREILLEAPADFQLKQMLDILKLKLSKRGIDLACLDIQPPEINL